MSDSELRGAERDALRGPTVSSQTTFLREAWRHGRISLEWIVCAAECGCEAAAQLAGSHARGSVPSDPTPTAAAEWTDRLVWSSEVDRLVCEVLATEFCDMTAAECAECDSPRMVALKASRRLGYGLSAAKALSPGASSAGALTRLIAEGPATSSWLRNAAARERGEALVRVIARSVLEAFWRESGWMPWEVVTPKMAPGADAPSVPRTLQAPDVGRATPGPAGGDVTSVPGAMRGPSAGRTTPRPDP